jgi:hypothetical protein
MNNDELVEQNKLLSERIASLEDELKETKEKLKKYTAPERNRGFYKLHKEEMLSKNKDYYREKVTPEKRKEYARTAYLNQKEKKKLLAASENI